MKHLLATGTFIGLTSFALANGKSPITMFITGAGAENTLIDPQMADSAKDLTGHLKKDFTLVTTVEEADLVVRAVDRGVAENGGMSITHNGYGNTSVTSLTTKSLHVTITLRNGQSMDLYGSDGGGEYASMVGWKNIAGQIAKQIRKFTEVNETTILEGRK
jgi:hypothetical protein